MNATPLRSVLYVDDEPDIREIVQIALGLTNTLAVHTAESGEQALTLARALLPDLVLLDVMMPGLDGPGTLNRMRGDPIIAPIPVIFMTAMAMPKEVPSTRLPLIKARIESPTRNSKSGQSTFSRPRGCRATL